MDIRFDNAFLANCMKAVESCDEMGKSRLTKDENGNVCLEGMRRLDDREIDDVQERYKNADLRSALLEGLRAELSDELITGSGKKLADRKIVEITAMLGGSATADVDAAKVKQILSDLKRVKDQALGVSDNGEFSDWEVDDDPEVNELRDIIDGEEEWQSVVRGHHAQVKPTVAQANFLIYGRTEAIARALDIDEEEAAQLTLSNFDRTPDGSVITFCVSRERADGQPPFEPKTLRLTTSGFLEPAADARAARENLNRTVSENSFAGEAIENPAASFRASDLAEVGSFLELFARVRTVGIHAVSCRTAVFNMLPDALRQVHELRRQGKLPTGAISPETWWKCLGLKGKCPGGKDQTALSRAFNAAVLEKVVDDFLTAKGWINVPGMKEWLASGYTTQNSPAGWRLNDVENAFAAFCAVTGCTYSQKLAFLKTTGHEKSVVSLFFRPCGGTAESGNAHPRYDRYAGVTVRWPKDGMIPAAKSNPKAWDSFAFAGNKVDDERQSAQLSDRFSEVQIRRILQIPNALTDWAGSFGVEDLRSLLTIDVEKSGDDMLMALRQPAFRAIRLDGDEEKYEQGADDMVTRYVVHKDGAYEMTGVTFEKTREIPMIVTKQRSVKARISSPTVAQSELLAQGKNAALARTLGIGKDEAARLLLDRFERTEDGTLEFWASGRPLSEPRKLLLTTDGFVVDESRRAEYEAFTKLLGDNAFATTGIREAALAFNVADLKAVKSFLEFFAKTELDVETEYPADTFRSALLNILPETLERVHKLRQRQGRPPHGPISLATWWNSLGLRGEMPAERDPATLSRAFYVAFKKKVVGDFLSARGLEGEEKVPQYLRGGFADFAFAGGQSYSQKLKALRSEDGSDVEVRPVFRLAAGGALNDGTAASIDSTRQSGLRIRYAPQVQDGQTTWTTHLVVESRRESEATVTGLRNQGLTDRQIKRILDIPEERRAWLGGFGLSAIPSKTTVDVEKSGADMVLTLRQPALIRQPDGENQNRSLNFEMRPDDLITRYVVHADGSYEMADSHFEKAREKSERFMYDM